MANQPIRGLGGYLFFSIGLKNTNLVEDVEILLPVKFRWIPISGFRGEVENVSANQRPGWPSCFSDQPEKHKLSRGRRNFALCQVSLNSIERFQRRSRKCSSQSEVGAALLFFRSAWKKNLVEGVEILLLVKYRWISFNGFGEVENVSANQRPGRGQPSCLADRPEKHILGRGCWDLASCQIFVHSVQRFQRRIRKCLSQSETRVTILFFDQREQHKLGRGHWDLASCQVSLNSVQRFQRRSRKCLSQSKASAAILFFFSIGLKNTKLVEDVEILLPVKFRWISFSGFRGEVENVSANQRPGWPSCFSDKPEKHTLGRGRQDFASCQVLLNSIERYRRRSRKCSSQSEVGAALLFFRSALKNLVEGVEILLLAKFSWISFTGFGGEVENFSDNQRPGGHFNFPIGPKNKNLVEDIKILRPIRFRWIPFSGFRGEVENVIS